MDLNMERQVLRQEYQWLLYEEVDGVVDDIRALLTETYKSFSSSIYTEQENRPKAEKFLLSSANVTHQAKCMVTLVGDVIYEADLALKLQKQPLVPHQTRIYPETPWRLQQVQDAGNHIQIVLTDIETRKETISIPARSGLQVINLLDDISDGVRRSRDALMLPRRRTLEELVRNPALKAFKPSLPSDAVVSFYIQAQKLVLAVYHLCTNNANKVDIAATYRLEATVPWLNHTLMLMNVILQKCQQLKDKVTMFAQYEDEFRMMSNEKTQQNVNAEDVDMTLYELSNAGTKSKSNNPFLDSPDDENDNSTPCNVDDFCRRKDGLFGSDIPQEITWM